MEPTTALAIVGGMGTLQHGFKEHRGTTYTAAISAGAVLGAGTGSLLGAASGALIGLFTDKGVLQGVKTGALLGTGIGGSLGAGYAGWTANNIDNAMNPSNKQASGATTMSTMKQTPEYRDAIRWLMQKRAATYESMAAAQGITPADNMSLEDVSRLNRRADARQVMDQADSVGSAIGQGLQGPVETSADLIGGLASGLWNGAKARAASEDNQTLVAPVPDQGDIPGVDTGFPGEKNILNEFNRKGFKPRPLTPTVEQRFPLPAAK